jgi:hypothetical protein
VFLNLVQLVVTEISADVRPQEFHIVKREIPSPIPRTWKDRALATVWSFRVSPDDPLTLLDLCVSRLIDYYGTHTLHGLTELLNHAC